MQEIDILPKGGEALEGGEADDPAEILDDLELFLLRRSKHSKRRGTSYKQKKVNFDKLRIQAGSFTDQM